MNAKEFGSENAETVILLHGGGLSWWNYKEVSSMLVEKGYHGDASINYAKEYVETVLTFMEQVHA